MKFLSKDWFKSKIEQATEVVASKVITKKIETILEEAEKEEAILEENPYKSLVYINGNLTVIFHDGHTISKNQVEESLYEKVVDADSKEAIVTLLMEEAPLPVKEPLLNEVRQDISILIESGLFEYRDTSVYMIGINRSIPALLVNRFVELLSEIKDGMDEGTNWQIFIDTSEDFIAHKKFWQKCCLNPNAESAEDLYTFLNHHQFKIDRHGNFYTYRRVRTKNSQDGQKRELVSFISNTYNKVKAIWKKKASGYDIFLEDGSYIIYKQGTKTESTYIGNLETMYLELPTMEENLYTSAHTGREDYRIGEIISMPRQNGDNNNRVSCSKG